MTARCTYVLFLAGFTVLLTYPSPGYAAFGMRVGGFDGEKDVTQEIADYVQLIDGELRGALDCSSLGRLPRETVLTPLKYRRQLVNGFNFIVKLRVGAGPNIVHVKFYKPFRGNPSFTGLVEREVGGGALTETSALETSANYADCRS